MRKRQERKEQFQVRLKPSVRKKAKAIAWELECYHGEEGSIAKLIEAIVDGRLIIKKKKIREKVDKI